MNDGTRAYEYGLDLVSRQTGIYEEYPLRDALGSVRQVTDAQSAITGYKSYQHYKEEQIPCSFAAEGVDSSSMLTFV